MRLAIVSPCYNEQEVLFSSSKRIDELLDSLISKRKIDNDSFQLLVNDGSTDNTWYIIEELHKENPVRFKGISLANNVGHQKALMAGMMTVKDVSDVVITIDVDLQDDLACIEQMIDAYSEGCEIVYGVKVNREKDPYIKRITAELFYRAQQSMGVKSVFNHADFRMMSRKALDILSLYPERNIYLRALIPEIGLRSTTVNDTISNREAGVSKYSLSKMFNLAVDGITSFSIQPMYYIIYVGALVFVVGLVGVIVDVVYSIMAGINVLGWASLILSIWTIGGLVLLSLGCVGLYIGKIYIEVKRRPLYNISKSIMD